jgi:hypothetical protein
MRSYFLVFIAVAPIPLQSLGRYLGHRCFHFLAQSTSKLLLCVAACWCALSAPLIVTCVVASGGVNRRERSYFSFSSDSFSFSPSSVFGHPSLGPDSEPQCSAAHYVSAVAVLYIGAVLMEAINLLLMVPLAIEVERESTRRAVNKTAVKVANSPEKMLPPLESTMGHSDLRRSVATTRLTGKKAVTNSLTGAGEAAGNVHPEAAAENNNFESSFAFLGFVTVELGLLGRMAGDIAITAVQTEVSD